MSNTAMIGLPIILCIVCICCISSIVGGYMGYEKSNVKDCKMSEWSSCLNGKQTRTVETPKSIFGKCEDEKNLEKTCQEDVVTPDITNTGGNTSGNTGGNINPSKPEDNSIFYIDTDYHHGVGYTNAEGEAKCKEYGSNYRYPTYNEMDTLNKEQGAETCAYGQYKDGAGLWMRDGREGCGVKGYNGSDVNRKLGVYCKGPIPTNRSNIRIYHEDISNPPNIFYINTDYHRGVGFTNTEGEAKCKEYGSPDSRYPTYWEMSAANKKYGAEACVYGQFKDGAGLWMKEGREGCGTKGYNWSDVNRKLGVYCTGTPTAGKDTQIYYKKP